MGRDNFKRRFALKQFISKIGADWHNPIVNCDATKDNKFFILSVDFTEAFLMHLTTTILVVKTTRQPKVVTRLIHRNRHGDDPELQDSVICRPTTHYSCSSSLLNSRSVVRIKTNNSCRPR